jgi:hypothetical protein
LRARRSGRTRRSITTAWLTGVLFATATALLSAALGLLPAEVDNALKHGWGGAGQAVSSASVILFALAGMALLGWAAWRWHERGVILAERGTAYLVEERATTWWEEEKATVMAAIGAGFASVLRVPGPTALDETWHWQADAIGAPQWDARTDQLVHSFRAVHYNDDRITHNALFTWAPWPVAMAFGARTTARSRGLVLNVRQRPSYTAGPGQHELRLTDEAHDFVRGRQHPPLEECAPGHLVTTPSGQLTVTIDPLIAANASLPVQPSGHGGRFARGRLGRQGAGPEPGLLILLIRVVIGPIGPIGLDLAAQQPVTLRAPASLIGPVLPAGPAVAPVAEWRLGSHSRTREALPWRAFPRVAEGIVEWVIKQAAASSCDVVVIAARMPQELAVGLGIQLGQRPSSWPWRMYPAIYDQGQLVVPDLQLGGEAVPPQRTP